MMGDWTASEALMALWPEGGLGRLHVIPALLALLLGPVVFLRRKGTVAHRLLGLAYVACMLVLNVSALSMYHLGGPNLFHFFAVVSLATVLPGIVAAVRGAIVAHYHCMCWSYFGLFAAGLSQVLPRTDPQFWAATGLNVYTAAGVITGVSGGLAWTFIRWGEKRVLPRYADAVPAPAPSAASA